MRKFVKKLFARGTIRSSIAASYRFSTYIVTHYVCVREYMISQIKLLHTIDTRKVGWWERRRWQS